jgi:hypothetical protein
MWGRLDDCHSDGLLVAGSGNFRKYQEFIGIDQLRTTDYLRKLIG